MACRETIGTGVVLAFFSAAGQAAPVMMGPEWAQGMCQAWNADPELTSKLVESDWVIECKKRGFKVMQIYRADCEGSPRIELRVSEKNGKAVCVYGGKAETRLDSDVDYLMRPIRPAGSKWAKAKTRPNVRASFQRLRFDGPMGKRWAIWVLSRAFCCS